MEQTELTTMYDLNYLHCFTFIGNLSNNVNKDVLLRLETFTEE